MVACARRHGSSIDDLCACAFCEYGIVDTGHANAITQKVGGSDRVKFELFLIMSDAMQVRCLVCNNQQATSEKCGRDADAVRRESRTKAKHGDGSRRHSCCVKINPVCNSKTRVAETRRLSGTLKSGRVQPVHLQLCGEEMKLLKPSLLVPRLDLLLHFRLHLALIEIEPLRLEARVRPLMLFEDAADFRAEGSVQCVHLPTVRREKGRQSISRAFMQRTRLHALQMFSLSQSYLLRGRLRNRSRTHVERAADDAREWLLQRHKGREPRAADKRDERDTRCPGDALQQLLEVACATPSAVTTSSVKTRHECRLRTKLMHGLNV